MELLEKLSAFAAPSGWEDNVRAFIRERAEALDLRTETDSLGNLFVYKSGAKHVESPVVLAAYLDEPGLMVTEILEDGFVKFGCTGDTDPKTLLGKKVLVGESAAPAVIGLKPIHLTPKDERSKAVKSSEMYLDLGGAKADLGDQGVFAEKCTRLGQHGILSKAMGRSVSCRALLKVLERELPIDIICAFATQRYAGSRGAYGAAAHLGPKVVITLDICPETENVKLGGGPAVPYMDEDTVFARELMRKLKSGAEKRNIPVQVCAQLAGKGSGGVWQTTGGGARVAEICCPVRQEKAPAQLADFRDIQNLPEVLVGFLEVAEPC